jgi:DNA-binding GntR family transcriptional regulator
LYPEAADTLALGGTIYQRVHEQIRNDILSGQISSGARLKISELAQRYGLSHMPVREALQQLQGEGLVILSPNRGASVRRMDARFIRSLFDIREALEGFLTNQAAEQMTSDVLERLAETQRRYDAAVVTGDLHACIALNRTFHEAILQVTGNEEALRLLSRHTALISALRARLGHAPDRMAMIQQEHWAILEALARGDGPTAQQIHAAHVRRAADDMLQMMQVAAHPFLTA